MTLSTMTMTGETSPPTPLTRDRCGAEFERDAAVAYLGERVVHARPDECVAAFRRLIAALEEENARLRRRLKEADAFNPWRGLPDEPWYDEL